MRLTRFAALVALLTLALPAVAVAQTYIDQLRRPKVINGVVTLPNLEDIDNTTDDVVCFGGVNGADDTDFCLDLDGTRPVLYSATDTTIEVSDILAMTGGASLAGAFTFTGTTFNLDPTGAYTLDMDAAQAITITTADMAAAYTVQAAGGEDLILLDYSAGSKKVDIGNATDDPAFNVLGAGQITLTGNVDASAGLDVAGGNFTAAGGTVDLDPTSDFTLNLDDGTVATITVDDDEGAGVFMVAEASNAYIALTTTNAAEALNFGNAGTNPSYAFQGTGDITAGGGLLLLQGGAGLDTSAAGALNVGAATATSVAITPPTTITGLLDLDAGATIASGQTILGDAEVTVRAATGSALNLEVAPGASDVVINLGDNAGGQYLSVTDSDDASVATVDSNGGIAGTSLSVSAALTHGTGTTSDGFVHLDVAEVQTTDATETTCGSITLLDQNAYHLEAVIVANDSGGANRASYELRSTVYRAGGAAVQTGGTRTLDFAESNPAWDAAIDVNTNDARVRVTGAAGATIEWACHLAYVNVSQN